MYKKILKGALITIILAFIIFFVSIILSFVFAEQHPEPDQVNLEKIELREDVELFEKHFDVLGTIECCYWKMDAIGTTNFGPSTFWIKAFIIVQEGKEEINNKYSWSVSDVSFREGLVPEITGYSEFNWVYSEAFKDDLFTNKFTGEAYFDTVNGIIYVDLIW